jgi:very-short-patch-repair endonuclease
VLVVSKGKYLDNKAIIKRGRELRRTSTDSEKQLWEQLRNRRLAGYKFLRQHPVIYNSDNKGLSYFVADFYCDEKKLMIELDGPIHDDTKEYDEFRDEKIKNLGLHVLRFKNEELSDIMTLLGKIKLVLNSIP